MSAPVDIAFTPSVKEIQSRKGSRETYKRLFPGPGFFPEIDEYLESFIKTQNSVFFATATSEGQPYIQHRGGPAGFIKVIDKNTLAFADYKGNRQFISQGNLHENNKAFLFMIDYTQRRRVKIWGRAKVVENDPALLELVMPATDTYRALPEQVIVFTVSVWDRNCPQHIPLRVEEGLLTSALEAKDKEIEQLKKEIYSLKQK